MRPDGPLDELAAELVVPARSGIYLAKSELIVLARLVEGSLRVNERRRMLADVLKSPDSLEGLSALVGRLMEVTQAHLERYAELAAAFPGTAPALAPWRERAARTWARLAAVREELAED
jgi:hypothetical protein